MNDIEAQEFLRLQQTVVEKVVAAQTSDVWRTAAATCRYVDSSGGTTAYYIRLAASPSPSITSPSSLNDLDANDFIVKKLNAGAVDVGDAVVLHYAGNLNTAYFLSTGECGSSGVTSHASTHATGGSDPITPSSIGAMASDATPTPAAHAASHASDGADPVAPAQIGAIPASQKGAENGVATLNGYSKLTAAQASAKNIYIHESTTLQLDYAGARLYVANCTGITITIPDNDTVTFPLGTEIEIMNYLDASNTSIAPATGVSLFSKDSARTIADTYACAALVKMENNAWVLVGDLS